MIRNSTTMLEEVTAMRFADVQRNQQMYTVLSRLTRSVWQPISHITYSLTVISITRATLSTACSSTPSLYLHCTRRCPLRFFLSWFKPDLNLCGGSGWCMIKRFLFPLKCLPLPNHKVALFGWINCCLGISPTSNYPLLPRLSGDHAPIGNLLSWTAAFQNTGLSLENNNEFMRAWRTPYTTMLASTTVWWLNHGSISLVATAGQSAIILLGRVSHPKNTLTSMDTHLLHSHKYPDTSARTTCVRQLRQNKALLS